jgi:translation initiation factor 4A
MTEHNNFDNLNLKQELLEGVYLYGFKKPSKIQIEGITSINTKKDCLLQSQSGTGKTCTYLLGILNKLEIEDKALILVPTRELAEQVFNVSIQITKKSNLKSCLCIGGINLGKNIKDIKSSNLVICTFGRMYHLINDKKINLDQIKLFAIDEADDLLNSDYIKEIQELIIKLKEKTQILLISATISRNLITFVEDNLKEPIKILLKKEDLVLNLINQYYLDAEEEENKFDIILDLYNLFSTSQVIIFCNTIRKVAWLAEELQKKNFTITCIHGKMTYDERVEIVKEFRNGNTRILLTTDLLSRGIDIPQVNMVINYDLPMNKETYIHRIGRCGRFGKKGVAITLVKMKDQTDIFQFRKMKTSYRLNISELPDEISID